MKGRLPQRTSNMGVLLQHEGSHVQDIGALLGPGTSAAGLLESQYMVNLDGAGNENGQVFCTPAELQEACDDDSDGCLQRPEKKRRLTSDQVQFLERSFELENRLEPERKVQIAQHLGLQPRQIAIWFQNRRARWKTKQLEKEYDTLKFSYDSLKSDHDILLKEKEELEAQVLSLTNKLFTTRNKDHTDFELSKLHKFSVSLETRDSSLVSEVGNANAKQEDVRSANSTVLDSESPPDTDEGRHFSMMELTCCSSDAFEPVRSDLSQVADADEIKGRVILSRLEDDSCTYEFQLEDQYFFFWP